MTTQYGTWKGKPLEEFTREELYEIIYQQGQLYLAALNQSIVDHDLLRPF